MKTSCIQNISENGIKIEATDDVLDYLCRVGFDPQYGARPLKRVMQREILNELSQDIIAAKIDRDSVVAITLDENGQIQFMNQQDVEI